MKQLWYQGQAQTDAQANRLFSRACHYGDGCFTTGVVVQGKWLDGQTHLARMDKQLARLKFAPIAYDDWYASIEPALQASLTSEQPQVIKLWVARLGPLGYLPEPNSQAAIMVSLAAMPAQLNNPALKLGVCQTPVSENAALAGIKHLNRLDSVLARAELPVYGWDEGIMLNQHQQPVCATQGNLVWYAQGQFFTPAITQAGVAGLGLQLWQHTEAASNWLCVSAAMEQLLAAECLCVCNAVRGIQWVESLELPTASNKMNKIWPVAAQDLARRWQHNWLQARAAAPALCLNNR
ncbi:aminotransferase IV [Thiomicrospira aerophila AL3]|uniref:Aminotransferase IV n=1 Tax=Thiomicrospira aerophila AL3 TaxID=717772 RepID=W0DV87_9GAMM|nr:aminotransferase class IV [Thiomicrospira aerophila]AHF00914.1 aminotransferase IV [Thiomicrospira aerophila AL3]